MSQLLHILTEYQAARNERRRAALRACALDDARWIAQDREGDWYAYSARPVPTGLGWDCEERSVYLFKGRPNGNWRSSIRSAPRRKALALLCHCPCRELPQHLAILFS